MKADRFDRMENRAPIPAAPPPRLVYCTYCHKTHAVVEDEKPCVPGAWLDPVPVR